MGFWFSGGITVSNRLSSSTKGEIWANLGGRVARLEGGGSNGNNSNICEEQLEESGEYLERRLFVVFLPWVVERTSVMALVWGVERAGNRVLGVVVLLLERRKSSVFF
jgi:hypothetical protein